VVAAAGWSSRRDHFWQQVRLGLCGRGLVDAGLCRDVAGLRCSSLLGVNVLCAYIEAAVFVLVFVDVHVETARLLCILRGWRCVGFLRSVHLCISYFIARFIVWRQLACVSCSPKSLQVSKSLCNKLVSMRVDLDVQLLYWVSLICVRLCPCLPGQFEHLVVPYCDLCMFARVCACAAICCYVCVIGALCVCPSS
jgi:hypothetical protein